jgi:hypothetical protein
VLTDLLITAICVFCAWRLQKKRKDNVILELLFCFYIMLALGTFFGGVLGHGLNYAVGIYGKLPGWIFSMLSVAFLERVAIFHARPLLPKGLGKFLSIANVVEMIVLSLVVFSTLNFFFVEVHGFYGLVMVVASLEFFVLHKTKVASAKYFLGGVFFAFVSAIVHISFIFPHKWFNHLDLGHVLLSIGAFLIYLGSQKSDLEKFNR